MASNQESGIGNKSVSNRLVLEKQEVGTTGMDYTAVGTDSAPNADSGSNKSQEMKSAKASPVDPLSLNKTPFEPLRFQVKLENGYFTKALKNDLVRNLYDYLYNLPPNSFIPSFDGYGLRYGKIWFSPENERSCIWLKQTLMEINEKAASEFKFCIQSFCLKQNKICLNIPWNDKENLTGSDVLHRLHFQNPNYLINLWKIITVKTGSAESRLII